MLELKCLILSLFILLLFVLPPSLFRHAFLCALLMYIVLVIELVIRVIRFQEHASCFGCM